MDQTTLSLLKNIAKGIAAQFGENCEVVVHELNGEQLNATIVSIENGHVTGRKVGEGPSHAVLSALSGGPAGAKDHLNYLTKTEDGRILKSSTIYVRDEKGDPTGVFAVNYDITPMIMADKALRALTTAEDGGKKPERITHNVGDLLDELIEQSVELVGKPVAVMTKEDKVKALHFLDDSGAFLITKSSEKISEYFGISKYTLYNYLGQRQESAGE